MIKIERREAPDLLKKTELKAHYYNDTNVTDALLEMQHNKCAYCEKLLDQEKEVDHYIPKDNFVIEEDENGQKRYDWNQLNQWKNLLYACRKCNGAKKKESPFDKTGKRLIIDPSESDIDPEEYLDFIIEDYHSIKIHITACEKDNKPLGRTTIDALRLDERKDHIGALSKTGIVLENVFLKLLINLKNGLSISHVNCQKNLDKISLSMKPMSPFTAFARAFFKQRLKVFYQDEASIIEEEIGRSIELPITIPEGCQV